MNRQAINLTAEDLIKLIMERKICKEDCQISCQHSFLATLALLQEQVTGIYDKKHA
jgi:hypothetical protein